LDQFVVAPGEAKTFSGIYTPTSLPITIENTVKVSCTDASGQVVTGADNATCSVEPCATTTTTTIPQEKACWLTGGGVKFEALVGKRLATANKGNSGPVISIGGNVNPACSPTAGDGGNWTHIDHKAKLFFQGRHIEVVECGNIPGLPPGSTSPDTQFNYIEFLGTGTLKGISGNKVNYGTVNFYARVEDRNEPGSKETLDPFIDQYWIRITDALGNVLYQLGNDVPNPEAGDTIPISGGNMQIHESSCDSYN
jgi:hypothetical protein